MMHVGIAQAVQKFADDVNQTRNLMEDEWFILPLDHLPWPSIQI